MPETLLEVKKDVGADSCSNSRTKEKHSQLALDDGNPLTVQSESISVGVCVCGGRGVGSLRAKDGRVITRGKRILRVLCIVTPCDGM